MRDGFIKVAAGTPKIRVADCKFNKNVILQLIEQAEQVGVKLLALPELCITGYTCGDLFLQNTLLLGAESALAEILSATAETDMLFAVGLPVKHGGKYIIAPLFAAGDSFWDWFQKPIFQTTVSFTSAAGSLPTLGKRSLFSLPDKPQALAQSSSFAAPLWTGLP